MLSTPKAAKMLGVSINTVRLWEKKGFLSAVYVSPTNRRFYSEEDVRNLLERGYQHGSSDDKTV